MSNYYQVYADGVEIYDPSVKSKMLINPVCCPSLEEAGNFTFTMDPSHDSYDDIVPYGTDIEVYEDGQLIFFGRPLPPTTGLYKQKTYHCEGAVAYLNDIIVIPMSEMEEVEIDGETVERQRTISAGDYITYVMSQIADYQTTPRRRLATGDISIGYDPIMLYKSDYKTALDVLREEILPYTGGYLKARKVGDNIYLDIVNAFGTVNQPIKAGVNLLDFASSQQGFYTAIVAKGGPLDGDFDGENVVTETPVYMNSEITGAYGVICAYEYFPECTTVEDLQTRCEAFLNEQQFTDFAFDISALDLHISNSAYDLIDIGKIVTFDSPFHLSGTLSLLVTGLEIHLDTGEKRLTLGGLKQKLKLTQQSLGKTTVNQQDVKFDDEPTEGSNHAVTSGGIYEALQAARDGWVHQIDGVEQDTGTVNFVTEESS